MLIDQCNCRVPKEELGQDEELSKAGKYEKPFEQAMDDTP